MTSSWGVSAAEAPGKFQSDTHHFESQIIWCEVTWDLVVGYLTAQWLKTLDFVDVVHFQTDFKLTNELSLYVVALRQLILQLATPITRHYSFESRLRFGIRLGDLFPAIHIAGPRTNRLHSTFSHAVLPQTINSSTYTDTSLHPSLMVTHQVKSSHVKKFYWHKFILFFNNHEVTETQLGLFVTKKYMPYLSNEKELFLTKQVSRVQNKKCHIIDIYANTNKWSRNKRVSTDWIPTEY